MSFKKLRTLIVTSICLVPLATMAELSLEGKSRIIFESGRSGDRARVDIMNPGNRDALANISIEWGDHREKETHMALSSPLVSIPAGQQRSVEVFYQGSGLPVDRESYFLLSLLDVPVDSSKNNVVQVALRHRYKFFFRPKLDMTQDQAATSLIWRRLHGRGGIEANNPSPYYLTITNLVRQREDNRKCGAAIPHVMLAPFSKTELEIPSCSELDRGLKYHIVSDSGRELEQHTQLQ